MGFLRDALAAMESKATAPGRAPFEDFLRAFSRGPERRQIQEYLKMQRDLARDNKVRAVNEDNITGVAFYDGCQHSCEGMLRWLVQYDADTVAQE